MYAEYIIIISIVGKSYTCFFLSGLLWYSVSSLFIFLNSDIFTSKNFLNFFHKVKVNGKEVKTEQARVSAMPFKRR